MDCKQVLLPLQSPTLVDMIEACSKVETTQYQMEQLVKKVTAVVQVSNSAGEQQAMYYWAIIEHFYSTLKAFLLKQKGEMQGDTPQARVQKTVFAQNHLAIPPSCTISVTLNAFFVSRQVTGPVALLQPGFAICKQAWEGPWDLVTWGCAYACVSTDAGVQWLPVHCV